MIPYTFRVAAFGLNELWNQGSASAPPALASLSCPSRSSSVSAQGRPVPETKSERFGKATGSSKSTSTSTPTGASKYGADGATFS